MGTARTLPCWCVTALLAAAGHGQRLQPYPIDPPGGWLRAVENGTRTAAGRPGPRYWSNTAHYEITAALDPQTARLTGSARLTYHNRSPDALRQLVLHLKQNLHRGEAMRTRVVEVLDGVELGEIKLDGRPIRPAVRDTRLTIRLAEPLAPGAKAVVELDWSYRVPTAGRAPRNGHEGDRVFYLAYWYPQFAVYDDVEGWVADMYRGNGEFYMGYADYDVAFTAPVGYLVRMTGELLNSDEVLTEKAREALRRAASTRDVVHVVDANDLEAGGLTATAAGGSLTWRYHAAAVRDVAVSVARTYLWDATHAVVGDRDGDGQDDIAMIHAVYEPNSGDWIRAAEYARHTIEFMSARLHPYPWPHMTACEGVIAGGMEFPMMTIVGGRRPAGTIAHELIHMWFPMLVGSNEKRYAWQDEGFTSFWTTLCRDDFNGSSNGPRAAILQYANVVGRGGDVVCMRHADGFVDDDFGFASYSKPAAVLHQLRGLLGDDVFFAAFRRYTADWAFKHPYPYDFFRSFADTAQLDLEPYFRTWFFETWQLEHALDSVSVLADRTLVIVADRGRALHPCTVEARLPDGSLLRQVVPVEHWRQHDRAVLTFPDGVDRVEIDPDVTTLDVDRRNNVWNAR